MSEIEENDISQLNIWFEKEKKRIFKVVVKGIDFLLHQDSLKREEAALTKLYIDYMNLLLELEKQKE